MRGAIGMDEASQNDQESLTPLRGSRNIFQVFWQRRGLLFFGLVAGIAIGLLVYSQRPQVYRSTAQVLVVKKQTANVLPVAGVDPRMAVMEDYVATHLIVIKSPIVITRAVQKRNLGSLKSLQGRDPVGGILAGLVATRDDPKASGSGTGGNNILNLSYTGSDTEDTEKILSAVIASYTDFLDETFTNTSNQTLRLMNEAINTINISLDQKNKEYKAFQSATPVALLRGTDGLPVHHSTILDYQKRETESREQLESIESRLEAVKKGIGEKKSREFLLALAERRYGTGTANQNREQKANATELEKALLPLYAEEADLKSFYGEHHPMLVRVRERIKLTKELFKKIDENIGTGESGSALRDPVQVMLETMQVELELARMNFEANRKRLADANASSRKNEAYYDQDKVFRNDIIRLERVLDNSLARLQQINLAQGGGFDAKTLAEPGPGTKVSPIFIQFLILGALMGLGTGALGAYLLDMADKSFRTPEEIRKRLGMPIIGHVPFVPASAEPVMTVDGAGNPVELDPGLIALHAPMSPSSEGFRGIRTALYFSTHAKRHTVIQVTSPNMGDGKTTLITNLAIAIAQSGRKVLIVDADLRRPRVHRAFGLAGKIGLAEVIAGTAELVEAVQITVVPNLSVLPCGRRPQNPAELLTSPQFEDVIDDMRGAFDYVLIDTPPLLAVSDPCIVAPRMDGLILAIRVAKNGRPAAERARDILLGLKVNCIGVVVNGVGKHSLMTGYGYEHYKYADEYTTAYTHAPDEMHSEGAKATQTVDRDPTKDSFENPDSIVGKGLAEVEPHKSVLKAAKEPSTNGHTTHALTGE